MTSVMMEWTSGGMKWWDYSGYFLNLHGRICAEGLLVFESEALPRSARLYVNEKVLKMVLCDLASVFIADLVYAQIHPNAG